MILPLRSGPHHHPCGRRGALADEFTGRLIVGRRFSDGQHRAIEAKAAIVAQAGRVGAVTIATNMAGCGTDILLGGANASPEEREAVLALGGLRAIGHRDPKLEYKEEAHKAFANLTQSMYEDYLQALLRGRLTLTPKTVGLSES